MDLLLAMWGTSVDFAPYLLLGTVLAGALHVVMPSGWLQRHLRGQLGVVKAALLGIPLPLCSCGVIPAGLGLRREGAGRGATVSFLISTPQTGVDSVYVSAAMLGWPFALCKVATALVGGLLGGAITEAWLGNRQDAVSDQNLPAADSGPPVVRALRHMEMLLRLLWPWLVVGILTSAVLRVFVPASFWDMLSRLDPQWAMLGVAALAVPLYVCTVASVPVAAALLDGGLAPSAALVFLLAGPATNTATLAALYRTLGGRTTAVYLAVVLAVSVGAGQLFGDLLLAPQPVTAGHSHTIAWWGQGAALVLWALFVYFAAERARSAWKRLQARKHVRPTLGLPLEGLRCNGCVQKLQQALERDERVQSATVTLHPPQVEATGDLSLAELRGLVERTGFRAGGQQRVHGAA